MVAESPVATANFNDGAMALVFGIIATNVLQSLLKIGCQLIHVITSQKDVIPYGSILTD